MCPPGLKGRSVQAFFRFRPGMAMTSSMAPCVGIRHILRCLVEVHALGPLVCQMASDRAVSEASGCS